KPVQCFGKAASDKMKSFVQGKTVILIDDLTQGNRDKYKRLLRYIYLPNSVRTFVNGEMVKQGYAFSYKQYPTKYLNKFNNFEKNARENNLGLWGSCELSPTQTIIKQVIPTKSNTYIAPTKNSVAPVQQPSNGSYVCNCSKSCSVISSCEEAYYQLNTCGCSIRDGDKDGIPCENLCK
ncbi:MAG: thermonuclease family protein, partial [Candidatus Levyibacteriota bacterium]